MSSSEDEAISPELGASSSKDPPPPLESEDAFTTPTKKKGRPNPSESQDLSDSDADSNDSEDQSACKKSRSYKRPPIEWENVVSFVKGDEATMDEDEMRSKVRAAAQKIMEDSRMIRLPSHVTRPGDEGLWKEIRSYRTDRGKTLVRWLRCPMSYRFNCKCQIKMYEGDHYIALDVRGQHNADSHSADKETSKHLKVKQIHALHTGVRCAPQQSAKALRRNLANFSPDKRIDPIKIRVVRRTVAKFRNHLTLEQLAGIKIDDSYGSLVQFTDAKAFAKLIEEHNNLESDFHFNLFEPFVIGRDLNPKDDIVYITFASIWHLLNFLRNIAAGWLFQVNVDATYKVCRRSVALLGMGVNSVGHVNNPVCWSIIPESESKQIFTGTWRCVQEAAMMLVKNGH